VTRDPEAERRAAQEITAALNASVPGILAGLNATLRSRGPLDPGVDRSTEWEAEDGWLVGYSTRRIEGGQYHGRFLVTAHRPTGPGARSGRGKVQRWTLAYSRVFATRKAARARAETLYRQHSPRWAAKHPVQR
jgi:hypothetical protein